MIINIALLFNQQIRSLDALRTFNGKRFTYYIQLENSENFVRVSENTYRRLNDSYSPSCMITKTEGEKVRNFTSFQIKKGVFN